MHNHNPVFYRIFGQRVWLAQNHGMNPLESTLNWYSVAPVGEIIDSGRRLFSAGELRLAVFHLEGEWVAIDNHCPHRGGPIAAGEWNGRCITCPWHAAQYDLVSGQPLSIESRPLSKLDVRVTDGILQVDLDSLRVDDPDEDDGIQRTVVRYGQGGEVGRFGTIHDLNLTRGARVVVQSHRGIELGIVLQTGGTVGTLRGEILRVATNEDCAAMESSRSKAAEVLELANQRLEQSEVRVQLVEADQTLDGGTVLIYYLGEATEQLGPVAVELGETTGKNVRFQKLILE